MKTQQAVEVAASLSLTRVVDERGGDFPLQINGESFVKPEVFEVPVRHQVTGPAMHYFVYYDVSLASITSLK